jgi:hypothetical protein
MVGLVGTRGDALGFVQRPARYLSLENNRPPVLSSVRATALQADAQHCTKVCMCAV